VVSCLTDLGEAEAAAIGRRAQERVLGEHSAEQRALQFEDYVATKVPLSQFA